MNILIFLTLTQTLPDPKRRANPVLIELDKENTLKNNNRISNLKENIRAAEEMLSEIEEIENNQITLSPKRSETKKFVFYTLLSYCYHIFLNKNFLYIYYIHIPSIFLQLANHLEGQ